MRQIILKRKVNENIRYLKIDLYKTLFNHLYMVEQVYGSVKNKAPTGRTKKFFSSYDDAIKYLNKYILIKQRRGYVNCSS